MKVKKGMKAAEIDKIFDGGGDVTEHLRLSSAKRPGQKIRRVNVDMPQWMIEGLDEEARRLGITRQAIVKVWLAEKLER